MSVARSFGVEVEYACTFKELKSIASKAIEQIYGKNSWVSKKSKYETVTKTDKWHIKMENDSTSELCSPLSTLHDISKMKKVYKLIQKSGIKCDEDCGVHLHVDCGDSEPNKILACWLYCEDAMFDCCHPDRKDNACCEAETNCIKKNKSIYELISTDFISYRHTSSVDFVWYDPDDSRVKRKSVEVRVKEGTTNANNLVAWIKFVVKWFDWVERQDIIEILKSKPNKINLESLIEDMGLKERELKTLKFK